MKIYSIILVVLVSMMKLFLLPKKILPALKSEGFYVELKTGNTKALKKKSGTRRNLPRIDKLIEWCVVKSGDILYATDRKGETILLENSNVINEQEKEQSLNSGLKDVLNYSSVQTYSNTFTVEGVSLSELRKNHLKKHRLIG